MPTTKPILVDALRTFVRDLKKRPDIKVESAVFRKKAPAALLKGASAHLGSALGGKLLAFYAAVNGVEIRWSFIEGPGGAFIHIPPLSDGRRFQAEDEHHIKPLDLRPGVRVQVRALAKEGRGEIIETRQIEI